MRDQFYPQQGLIKLIVKSNRSINSVFLSVCLSGLFVLIWVYLGYKCLYLGDGDVVFNFTPSGRYRDQVKVFILNTIVDSQVRYTTNGDEPDQNSTLYSGPLEIKKTTTLKYGVFRNTKQLTKIWSKTYLINEHSELPIITLDVKNADFFDTANGIYTPINQEKKGKDYHRLGHMEFYEPNGKKELSQAIDIRIYGGKTRRSAQKSLLICGVGDQEFRHKVFLDQDKYKCLLLRNSGNDWNKTMLRDGFMQNLVKNFSTLDTQNYRPAILFINGRYWGIHNIRESYNKYYFRDKYKIKAKDVVVLFPNRANKGYPDVDEGDPGDEWKYQELKDLVRLDIASGVIYDKVKKYMDIDNYIDYMVFQTFFNNNDWIDGNLKIWYYKGLVSDKPKYPQLDGKLSWLVYDLDSGFAESDESPYRRNQIALASRKEDPYNKTRWQYVVFNRLLENPEFKAKFIARYRQLLDSAFRPENLLQRIEEAKKAIENEMPRHIERWKNEYSGWHGLYLQDMDAWEANIERMRVFARERAEYVAQHVDELEAER